MCFLQEDHAPKIKPRPEDAITYYTGADSISRTLSSEIMAQNLSSVCYVDWEAQPRSTLPATQRRVVDDSPEEPDFLDRFDELFEAYRLRNVRVRA